MRRVLPTLAFSLLAGPALAAWASIGSLGTNQSKTSSTTVVITTTADAEVGNVIVVGTAWDNTATVDGASTNLSVADEAGNTYVRALEFSCTNGGAAGDCATAAVFYSMVTVQLNTGATLTVTSNTASTAKAAAATEFTIGAGNVISVAGSATLENNAVDPGAVTISGLASQEYLWFVSLAAEGPQTDAYTEDADYSSAGGNGTTGAGAATNMHIRARQRVFTGTTDTFDLTSTTADRDYAQAYVALLESAPPACSGSPLALLGVGCR